MSLRLRTSLNNFLPLQRQVLSNSASSQLFTRGSVRPKEINLPEVASQIVRAEGSQIPESRTGQCTNSYETQSLLYSEESPWIEHESKQPATLGPGPRAVTSG